MRLATVNDKKAMNYVLKEMNEMDHDLLNTRLYMSHLKAEN